MIIVSINLSEGSGKTQICKLIKARLKRDHEVIELRGLNNNCYEPAIDVFSKIHDSENLIIDVNSNCATTFIELIRNDGISKSKIDYFIITLKNTYKSILETLQTMELIKSNLSIDDTKIKFIYNEVIYERNPTDSLINDFKSSLNENSSYSLIRRMHINYDGFNRVMEHGLKLDLYSLSISDTQRILNELKIKSDDKNISREELAEIIYIILILTSLRDSLIIDENIFNQLNLKEKY